MKESKFSRFQTNVTVIKQKCRDPAAARGRMQSRDITCLAFGRERGSSVSDVEVRGEEVLKVLGEECREGGLRNSGIWGKEK